MIFVQPFCDNFYTTLSHIHIMILLTTKKKHYDLTLPFFISLLFLTNKKIEKEDCHKSYHGYINIITL
jgi:hypothetical protein